MRIEREGQALRDPLLRSRVWLRGPCSRRLDLSPVRCLEVDEWVVVDSAAVVDLVAVVDSAVEVASAASVVDRR